MKGQKVELTRVQIAGLMSWFRVLERWGERPQNAPDDWKAPKPLAPKFNYAFNINADRVEPFADAYAKAIEDDEAYGAYKEAADKFAREVASVDEDQGVGVPIPPDKVEEFNEGLAAIREEHAEAVEAREAFNNETETIDLYMVDIEYAPEVPPACMKFLKHMITG